MRASFKIALLTVLCSTTSFAEAPSANSINEKKKAKTVSRLYQATYGSSERCKAAGPDAAQAFENELNRFVDINANLIKLVIQSPHYDAARKQFANHVTVNPARDTPDKLSDECNYLAQILRSMNDTPEGKKAAKEYEVLLSN